MLQNKANSAVWGPYFCSYICLVYGGWGCKKNPRILSGAMRQQSKEGAEKDIAGKNIKKQALRGSVSRRLQFAIATYKSLPKQVWFRHCMVVGGCARPPPRGAPWERPLIYACLNHRRYVLDGNWCLSCCLYLYVLCPVECSAVQAGQASGQPLGSW